MTNVDTLPSATGRLIRVEEYLRTSYRPDRELIDGELREKPMPTVLHGFVQMVIGSWFAMRMTEWGVAPQLEVRTRIRPTDFRLPDVSVVPFPAPFTKTQDTPPLLAIEILSEDDKVHDLQKRAGDLHAMGVRHIWLIDSEQRSAMVWTDGTYWHPESRLTIAGTAIYLDLDWLWSQIDLRAGIVEAPGPAGT